MNKDGVCVGLISRPVGLNGSVKIIAYTTTPSFFLKHCLFFLDDLSEIKLINQKVKSSNELLSQIEGINSRTAAEKLKNKKIYIDKCALPPLATNEYYFNDLINLNVCNKENKQIGSVLGVNDYGAGTFLDIKMTGQKSIATIQFNKETILVVDIINKFIIINEDFLIK